MINPQALRPPAAHSALAPRFRLALRQTHKRHFLQQSDYTLCMVFKPSNEWHFAMHEDMFRLSEDHQDLLWKFNIPWSERLKVLKILDTYNLNAFSLLDSEECLVETMALRTFQFLTGTLSSMADAAEGSGGDYRNR